VASSARPIGRIGFVLRILLTTALCRAFEFVYSRNDTSHLNLMPRYIEALGGVIVFGFLGVYVVKAISGRLLDARLPRWYRFPMFSAWLLSSLIPIIWPRTWPIGFALFAVLLLVGGLFSSKQVFAASTLEGKVADEDEKGHKSASSNLRRVGPIGFLRNLLTIGCLCCPLILLDTSSVQGAGVWVARIGYFILGIVWLAKILGRLEDAGRLSPSWFGSFVVAAVLLMRMFSRMQDASHPPHLFGFSISDTGHTVFSLLPWLKFINDYEMLAVFLLVQVPLALLPSKFGSGKSASPQKPESRFGRLLAERRSTGKRLLVGPFAFLRRLLVLAFLGGVLIYLDSVSNGGIGSWSARLGYFILIYAWMMNSYGRFEDAGWTEGWYGAQYWLVVSVISLMPFAIHWVNGYGSLVIFVLIQIPTVLLRSKARPGKPVVETGGHAAKV
jgi:hypothetical protein